MKIGIIADIHNNAVALDAILKMFKDECCETIICAGDILSIGPFPQQTVERIMSINNLFAVSGNHDRYLTQGIAASDNMDYEEVSHHNWEKSVLSASAIKFISSLPYRIDTIIDNVRITILHYAMKDNGEYMPVIRDMTEYDCKRLFESVDSDVIIFGHSHKKIVFECNGKLYINCGSLGCPSKELNVARGGIMTLKDGKATVKTVEIHYDADKVINEINRLNYPCAGYIKRGFYGLK